MAVVKIKYFGMLKDIVGSREELVAVGDEARASEIVRVLAQKHGVKFSDFVLDKDGTLRSGFAYAINGTSVSEPKLSATKCKDIHEFVILPPISGG